jgi:molybdopterin-guanine dinucleotide biosynthesis protein A
MTARSTDKLPLSGTVLAGGRARRFGGFDKTRLKWQGESLLERSVKLLSDCCQEVLISSNILPGHPNARIIADRTPGQGPLGAIASCLAAASHPWLLVIAGDLPFINSAALYHLWEYRQEVQVVIPRTPDGLQPLAALYHQDCQPAIARQLAAGGRKIKDFFPHLQVCEIDCSRHPEVYPPHTFLNINSPADLETARRLAATHP